MSEKTRLLETQKQVDEVVDIVKDNLDGLIRRDDKLDELEQRSHQVRVDAELFKENATGLKRKMWWKNRKMCIILIVVIAVIIAVIVVWLAAIK